MVTAAVVALVAAALAGADKAPQGPQLHHFVGQDGYDSFGQAVAHPPVYGGPQHDIGIGSGGYSDGGGVGASGSGYGGHSGGHGGGHGGYGGGGYPPPETLSHTSYKTQYVPVLQPIHGGGGGGGGKGKGKGKGGPFTQFNKMIEDAGKKLSKFGKSGQNCLLIIILNFAASSSTPLSSHRALMLSKSPVQELTSVFILSSLSLVNGERAYPSFHCNPPLR